MTEKVVRRALDVRLRVGYAMRDVYPETDQTERVVPGPPNKALKPTVPLAYALLASFGEG